MDVELKEKRRQKAERILSTVYNLPTVPFIIFEVTKIIENPKSSAAQLAKIINQDQGMVTKILSVANSPLYGIPRRVSTIDFAIVILGFNHIKNIVIALSMMDAFKNYGDRKFEKKEYWLHSILTATAAKRLADDLGYRTSGEVFTAGLLHDLGIPIIYKYFGKEYKQIMQAFESGERNIQDAEIEYLGISHNEVGQFLADKWNLPESLSEAIFFHHNPSQIEKNKQLGALVHLADYMTYKLQTGSFSWDNNYIFDDGVIEILKLGDREYLDNFIESYRTLFTNQLESIKL